MDRQAGCNCGSVRIALRGEPVRVGLCHCLTCRKEAGTAFNAFAVWESENVTVTGETRQWTAATDHRHFCPVCGASLFNTDDEGREVEVRIGALDDAPSGLAPSYELWIKRREHWQSPVDGTAQFDENRQ